MMLLSSGAVQWVREYFFKSADGVREFADRNSPRAGRHRWGREKHARLFEFLEQRQLLSASLVVTGNGAAISNGESSPTVTTFTDFTSESTTANPALGFATRTYTITNTSTSTIFLTGGANLVQVTGANAGDFTVLTAPASTIAAGASTNFKLQFLPQAAGARTATVSIFNSSSDESTFSFAVKGAGLTTTNAASNLQVATQQAGSGDVTAVNGDVLAVRYTGYLLDGTIFDTNNRPGAPLLTNRLDDTPGHTYLQSDRSGNTGVDGGLIDGFEQGLQGVKVGETRTLIIPSSLGYGASGQGNIPGNATLIFDITVKDIGYSPKVGVQGNNIDISSGTTTTSATNNTDFGTLAAGTTSATRTFALTDVSEATNANGTLIDGLTITNANTTGPAAGDFTVAPNGNGGFVLTFTPSAPGERTATVHVLSNDPNHPDFAFAVSGNSGVDLQLSLGTTNLPASVVAGSSTVLSLPVTVKNVGQFPPSGVASASVQVFLQDTTSGVRTSLPGPFFGLNVSGLAANASKSFVIPLNIPNTTPAGTYKLAVVINADGGIAEANSANDSVTTTQTISVTQSSFDLAGSLISTTIPASGISGLPVLGNFVVAVSNVGHSAMPKSQQVTIAVIAHNTLTGANTALTTSPPKSVSLLKAGVSQKFSLPIKFAAGLSAGSYQLEAQINPVQPLNEASTTNNLITHTSGGAVLGVTTGAAFNDLTGALVTSSLKSTAASVTGSVSATVQSIGNVALPAGQQIQLKIIAHPVGAVGTSSDITLQLATFSVKGWKPGHTAVFKVPVKFLSALAGGTYDIEASIITLPTLAESNTTNNLLKVNSAGQMLTLVA